MTTQSALAATPDNFSDVPSTHPNYTAIMDLKTRGIIAGYPDGTFKPDQMVNRVEALKIILLGSGLTGTSSLAKHFSDTPITEWYTPYLHQAVALNIVEGYPDGTFKPNQTVNLVENLKILLLAKKIQLPTTAPTADPYADTPKTQWYASYVQYAKDHNLIDADSMNMVYPAQGMTRAKLAETIYRLIYIEENKLDKFGQEQSTPPTAPENNYLEVNIQNFAFTKSMMTIPLGGTVRWTNNDTVPHTVTSDSGAELNSATLNPGDTYIHTFSAVGTFTYHCNIHKSMTGTITVKPANEVPTI